MAPGAGRAGCRRMVVDEQEAQQGDEYEEKRENTEKDFG